MKRLFQLLGDDFGFGAAAFAQLQGDGLVALDHDAGLHVAAVFQLIGEVEEGSAVVQHGVDGEGDFLVVSQFGRIPGLFLGT